MNQEEKGKMTDQADQWDGLPWKAWGSWFSWGSPVGVGVFLVCVGAFVWMLHLAGLIAR